MPQQKISPLRTSLLLSIVVSVSAVLGFLLAFGKIVENNFSFAIIPAEKKVIIMTDKTEYLNGEEVKFSLINNLSKGIWYVSGELNCSTRSYEIYNFSNNEWNKISIHPPVCLAVEGAREPIYKSLLSNNFLIFEWNQNQWDYDMENYNIKADRYIISMRYMEHNGVNILDNIVYSNVFTIKEKSTIDSKCSQRANAVNITSGSRTMACMALGRGIEFNSSEGKCIAVKFSGACSVESPFENLEECQKTCE